MDIGQRIRNLRMQKQLTQEELGERTDLSKGYISQLEHNQSSPSMETFFAIIEVLGMTPAAFFAPEPPNHKIVYHPSEHRIYDDEALGYQLKWLVPASNENELEPVTVTLAPNGCFKSLSHRRRRPSSWSKPAPYTYASVVRNTWQLRVIRFTSRNQDASNS